MNPDLGDTREALRARHRLPPAQTPPPDAVWPKQLRDFRKTDKETVLLTQKEGPAFSFTSSPVIMTLL